MDGAGVAAVLALGAQAAQLGTAFAVCVESGATPTHKKAVASMDGDETTITRAFTGKPARGAEPVHLRGGRAEVDAFALSDPGKAHRAAPSCERGGGLARPRRGVERSGGLAGPAGAGCRSGAHARGGGGRHHRAAASDAGPVAASPPGRTQPGGQPPLGQAPPSYLKDSSSFTRYVSLPPSTCTSCSMTRATRRSRSVFEAFPMAAAAAFSQESVLLPRARSPCRRCLPWCAPLSGEGHWTPARARTQS